MRLSHLWVKHQWNLYINEGELDIYENFTSKIHLWRVCEHKFGATILMLLIMSDGKKIMNFI